MYGSFDIGGTKMRIAVSVDSMTFKDPVFVDTPKKFEDAIEIICFHLNGLAKNQKIISVAGGITGIFDSQKGVLMRSPHLTDWIGKPFTNEIENRLNTKVYVENDTAMVGFGEASIGAGRDGNIVVYITVSTGVGGVKISNKKISEHTLGFEAGHQIIDYPNMKSLEDLVSGESLEKKYEKKAYLIDDPKVWEEEAKTLAVGVYNMILHWSPDVVVLGGSMIIGDPAIDVSLVEENLKNINKVLPVLPAIKKAELDQFGGIHGGFAYLRGLLKVS